MTIPGIKDPAIPYGGTVVITGASGLVGSHVTDQALAAGFKVRATTRSIARTAWLCGHFQGKYGTENFELVEVSDMLVEGAFDEVVKGASGFIHVANDMGDSKVPKDAISRVVDIALNALRSAAGEPGLKRFVYTSSSFAVTLPKPEKEFTLYVDTFNDEVIERVKKPDPSWDNVYAAGKVEAERAIATWLEENDSKIVVNTIQPNANTGPPVNFKHQGHPTTTGWVKSIWTGDYDAIKDTPPQHFVDVQDDAKLHIIALARPDVGNERIFAITGPVSFPAIIEILREKFPEKNFRDWHDQKRDLSTFVPSKRAEELLTEAYGHGFASLEESVMKNVADLTG